MASNIQVFISSKMLELKAERETLANFIPTLNDKWFEFTTWLFERDAPATEQHIRGTYLAPLKASRLYIGLLWNEFGEWTIDEFEEAGKSRIDRLLFLKDVEPEKRESCLRAFLNEHTRVTDGLTICYFQTIEELCLKVRNSIQFWIDRQIERSGALSALLVTDPDSVPEQAEKFIGRDDILSDIAFRLRNGEKVLLYGFSGIGKTALAAQVTANWLRKEAGTVLWLRVGSEEAESTFKALTRPFGTIMTYASAASWKPHIINLFTKNSVKLIVLDDVWNAETLYYISKALPPQCPVIITSREKYPIGNPLEVSKLPPHQAIEVLNYHSGQNFTHDPDAVALCEIFDYHTYALEIAGSIIKVDNLSPVRLLQEVEPAPQEMAMPGGYSEKGRENVSALLRKSLVFIKDSLAHEVFLTFGNLIVPYATPDMLRLILEHKGISATFNEVASSLKELTRRSLAWRIDEQDLSNEFYYIHDLAHSFAREEADVTDDSTIMAACLEYAKANWQDIKALNPEIDNLVWAVQQFAAIGNNEAIIDIAGSVYGLEYDKGHILPGIFRGVQMLLYAVDAANNLDQPLLKAGFLIKLAIFHRMNKDINGAISYWEAAITAFERVEAEEAIANFLNSLADAYTSNGNQVGALGCYEKSLNIYKKLNSIKGVMAVLRNLGDMYSEQGLLETALDYYNQAHQLSENLNDAEEFPFISQEIATKRHKTMRKLNIHD